MEAQYVDTSIEHEPWTTYAMNEPLMREFVAKYTGASLAVTTLEITTDGVLRNERSFTDKNILWNFLTTSPIPTSTSLRIVVVKEICGEGLQMISTALGIHFGFWEWVISNDASDGFWLNSHNEGKILSFDLPGLEFYATTAVPTTGVVREGRLKHLSSRHRLFGNGLMPAESYEVYVNRRVSGYLVPHGNIHTMIYFSEDCTAISSIPLQPHPRTDPVSTEWFINFLKSTERDLRKQWTQEPTGLMIMCVRRLLRTWHIFTVQTQRDLEKIDASLPESLPTQLPVHNLYDVGTYLHRDIVQTLYRFSLQLGKYDGWLGYVSKGTLDKFRPKLFMHEISWLQTNFQDLQRRLEGCKGRGNGSLALINNYIALQQARLAHEQASISAQVAVIQQKDSQSGSRLSIVATIFLPLSFAATFLSTNTVTPLWVFFIIAIPSVFVTLLVILFLKWMEKEEDTWLRRAFRTIFWKKKTGLPQLSYEDAVNLKVDPSLLLA